MVNSIRQISYFIENKTIMCQIIKRHGSVLTFTSNQLTDERYHSGVKINSIYLNVWL